MHKLKIIAGVAAFSAATALPANAQLVPDSDEPVDITSDVAEFQDNLAVWKGNVRVVQGDAIMTAARLEAVLSDDGVFSELDALGVVRFSNGKEAISGERAHYDDAARTIEIFDNVIVTQGSQVMAAGSVTYWIDTGKIVFEPRPGERIRGIFYTNAEDEQS